MRHFLLCLLAALFGGTSVSAQFVWNNAAGGSWQTGTNWDPNGLPGAADNVTIDLTGTTYGVTLGASTSVNNLTVNSATATLGTLGQSLTINGAFQLQAGTLAQSSNIGLGATGTFNTSIGTVWSWSGGNLTSGTFTNGGAVNFIGGTRVLSAIINNSGTFTMVSAGIFQTNSGAGFSNAGLWNLQADSTAINANGIVATFTNSGTLRKSAGAGVSTIDAIFNSTGIVESQTGRLQFTRGGTVTGTFHASAGAAINLGSLTLSGTITGPATGTVRLNGTVGVATGGATLNYGGTTAVWQDGTINGSGTLTNVNNLAIASSVNKVLATPLANSSTGTITVTGVGEILTNTGASFSNAGLWDLQVDSTVIDANGIVATFTNSGTLRKSVTTGVSTIDAIFNSTSTVDAQTGTLQFSRGGTVTGTIQASPSAAVNLNTLTLSGTITGTATGTVRLNGSVGVAAGGATLNYGGTTAVWRDGTINGSGTLTNVNNLAIASSVNKVLAAPLANSSTGTITVTGIGEILTNTGASFSNAGLWNLQVNSTVIDANGIVATFTNSGTLRKSVTTGVSTIDAIFNSTGIVEAQTGTLQFSRGGTVTGTANASASATVNLNTLTLTGTLTGTGGGTVRINGTAPDTIANGGATINYAGTMAIWDGGSLDGGSTRKLTNSGTLNLLGGSKVLVTGLTNTGTLNYTRGSTLTNSGASINNTGTFNLGFNGATFVTNGATATFTNTGTLSKTAGTGVSTLDATFVNNGGTIAIPTGTVSLTKGLSFGDASTLELTGGASANTHLAVTGLVSKTGTQALTIRLTNDGTLDLTGATQYNWLILDGTNLGTLTPADFTATGFNFNLINTSVTLINSDVFLMFNAVPIPEPTLSLVLIGGVVAAWRMRRSMGASR